MRFKRIIGLFLCVALVAITSVSTAMVSDRNTKPASATTINEYESLIDSLEQEQREIESQIKYLKADKNDHDATKKALQSKIDNLQNQITACNRLINDYDKQIKQREADIEAKQAELVETKYVFRQRLRAIYMSGGMTASSLNMLLSADDLGDLLSKMELTKCISAYDNALVEKISSDVKAIEDEKAAISALADEQQQAKAKLKEKKAQLDEEVKEVSKVISGISSQVGKLENKSDSLDKAIEEYEAAIKAAQSVGSNQSYDGQFTWPCPGYYTITSPYGYRIHPISGQYKFHKGVDISGGGIKGKPIVAAADGIVSIASYNSGGYGNYVMVNHGTGSDGKQYSTLYAHMTRYCVSVGQSVKKGQTIGFVGTTGASTGYHLHFEIRVNNNTTNPMSYY